MDYLAQSAELGRIAIAPEVIAQIVGHTAAECYGVVGMAGKGRVARLLTRDKLTQGIEVDARVSRGRTYRDALRHLLESEQFDRVIVSATDSPRKGLTPDDLEWLLTRVPAEVLILRPAPADDRRISAEVVHGHF